MTLDVPQRAIEKWFGDFVDELEENILLDFDTVGIDAVRHARLKTDKLRNWTDQTNNLRSSIGYAIYRDNGLEGKSDFEVEGNSGSDKADGKTGSETGKKLVESLAGEMDGNLGLAVVAGMDYASYLETRYNRDVLSSTESLIEDELNKRLPKTIQDTVDAFSKRNII